MMVRPIAMVANSPLTKRLSTSDSSADAIGVLLLFSLYVTQAGLWSRLRNDRDVVELGLDDVVGDLPQARAAALAVEF
jgi:hypothetical protein